MLALLRRIVQEINSAHDFAQALQILVQRVRTAVETQACSVFLVDSQKHEFVLMATDGLNPATIGKIRIPFGQGLISLVADREEPINLDNASSHPNFIYHPDVGEEKFQAFLGVPIIHRRELMGVLIIQQEERRRFGENEEAFLVTVSAQLSGLIAHAEATGAIAELIAEKTNQIIIKEICIEGIPSSPGIGIGQIIIVYPPADLEAVPEKQAQDIKLELQLFNNALQAAREEIQSLSQRMQHLPEQEHALFDAYLKMLDDDSLGQEIRAEILNGQWAQGALRKIIKSHIRQFEQLDDPYLRERTSDIRDLGRRILFYLQERQQVNIQYPEKTILIGDEVTPSAIAEVPEGQLVGIVSIRGSNNSHVAILARALAIPCVMGVDGLFLQRNHIESETAIVDGYYGQVYIAPTQNLLTEFSTLAEEENKLDSSLEALHGHHAVTTDGHMVSLFINTGLPADASLSLSVGAEGVGLYRTEIPFMIRDRFPAEEEQRIIYRQLLNAFAPRPVIMRTLDIGGDKNLPYFPIVEENPFLGWRGIRITLDHPEVFLVQVRAMLKASQGLDNLRIMLPMVTNVRELDDALELIQQAYSEVTEEGIDIKKPPLGVMLEVPAAAYQVRRFAKRVDFLSVGTNDLTQYILAVDRNNSRVANLYDSLNPAVIHALQNIIEGARLEGKKVSVCGEMASDPACVILLVGLGYHALSMSSVALPRIKWVIRNFSYRQAKDLVAEIDEMEDPLQIRFHLEQALENAGLGRLIRAGR